MFLMLDGMYSVCVILEGGDWTTQLRTNFPHVLARCFDLCFILSLLPISYVLRYVVYNFSIFLVFWYVIIYPEVF